MRAALALAHYSHTPLNVIDEMTTNELAEWITLIPSQNHRGQS